MPQEFIVEDCSLVRCATGRACCNLRELLDAVRSAQPIVLEHHMMRCASRTISSCMNSPMIWSAGVGTRSAIASWRKSWHY